MIKMRFALIVIISLLAIGISFAAVLDPNGPPNPILLNLAPVLDAKGIDVILGAASGFKVGERPRLANLSGFTATPGKDWGQFWGDIWTEGFEKGLVGALVAVPRGDSPPPTVQKEVERCKAVPADTGDVTCDFLKEWLGVDKGKRIFIAFTRSDLPIALNVKEALEQSGYAVFTYLRQEGKDPWAHPDFVGAVFAHSGQCLVIDTINSRGSEGVEFEAKCINALMPKRIPADTSYLDFIPK